LKGGVINSGEVASTRRLVFLRSQGKAVHVNTFIRVTCVGLVRLDPREVRTFTLREAVLAVKLELSDDNRVLSPTVEVQRGLRKNECSGIRDSGTIVVASAVELVNRCKTKLGKSSGLSSSRGILSSVKTNRRSTKVDLIVRVLNTVPVSSVVARNIGIKSTSVLEETTCINVCICSSSSLRSTEGMDSVRKSINGISVVERLGTKNLEKGGITKEGRTVINVLIRLDNPDKLLHRVVEVELNLVTGRTDGLVTSELKLADQVLVRVLGESAALVSIKEDVVNVEGSSNKGLVVGNNGSDRGSNAILGSGSCTRTAVKGCNSPETLINRTDIKINLDLVVLESNQRKGKTRVGTEPKLKRNIKSGLRKSITRSTHLTRGKGVTRSINISERRIGDEGELSGVTNHLEVTTLLFRGHSKLVPDVHPVTILTVNTLTTNLNLNLSNELLTREI
jgi:hypothetical protein